MPTLLLQMIEHESLWDRQQFATSKAIIQLAKCHISAQRPYARLGHVVHRRTDGCRLPAGFFSTGPTQACPLQ
jgi:hypothetical protein